MKKLLLIIFLAGIGLSGATAVFADAVLQQTNFSQKCKEFLKTEKGKATIVAAGLLVIGSALGISYYVITKKNKDHADENDIGGKLEEKFGKDLKKFLNQDENTISGEGRAMIKMDTEYDNDGKFNLLIMVSDQKDITSFEDDGYKAVFSKWAKFKKQDNENLKKVIFIGCEDPECSKFLFEVNLAE